MDACFKMMIQVHSKSKQIQVEVMERVSGLSIQGLSPAIPVGVTRSFVAKVLTGKPITFLWTFDLYLHKTSAWAKEVLLIKP